MAALQGASGEPAAWAFWMKCFNASSYIRNKASDCPRSKRDINKIRDEVNSLTARAPKSRHTAAPA